MPGWIDVADSFQVRGWCLQDKTNDPDRVIIYVEGEEVAQVPCNLPRPDVKNAGWGTGHGGYCYLHSNTVEPQKVTVRSLSSGELLPRAPEAELSPRLPEALRKLSPFEYRTIKRQSLSQGLWFCFPTMEAEDTILFEGYLIPPFLIPGDFVITINDKPLRIERGAVSGFEAIIARFDQIQRSEHLLTFSFRLTKPFDFSSEIEIAIRLDGICSNSLRPFYFSKATGFESPEITGMVRTTMIRDVVVFDFTGLTDFKRIQTIAAGCFPEPMQTLQILDWGCGCGRVSRFAEKYLNKDRIFGVDIDPVNIAWNKKHLDEHRYSLISFQPDLPFGHERFDLIYGISVMTHLRASDQIAWLKELHRVLKPHGVLILSYLGLAHFFAHLNNETMLEQLLRDGILDTGRNTDLDEGFSEVKQKEFYRNTFNTIDNIAEQSSSLFEIKEFAPGGHLAQQDYVVFRKR